jgi:hypothetical protein
MARLLRDKDILKVAQSENLQEHIDNHKFEWLDSELVAQEEMTGYLAQRYLTDEIFTNTSVFDKTLIYKAKNLVEYTETAFNEATSYAAKARVSYNGKIYEALQTTQGNLPDDVNNANWIYITDDLSLYYVTLPQNEWDKETTYASGDKVWYKDKVYTAAKASTNIIPTSSSSVWGSGTSYSITDKNPDILYHAEVSYTVGTKVSYEGMMYSCILNSTGNLPTNATYFTASTDKPYWTKGDNRNPLIVRYLLDITRYHFERAIPARNVSDLLKEAYNGNSDKDSSGAIGWLRRVASGKVNANLPEIIPVTGNSITFGSSRAAQDNQLW